MLLAFIAIILLFIIIVGIFMFTDREKALETVSLSQFMGSNPKDDVEIIKTDLLTDELEENVEEDDDINDYGDGIIGKINEFFDTDEPNDDFDGGDDGGDDM
ncbi:hypothetical protein ACFYKX_19285 [Cytobacillus sp. FJAT-54145]|uniref:Uncharacterized protein n=1 Tax=Cytobacillus spartinae TaxID=3299023 RepID=A0ABW6KIS3_9BACI